MQSFGCGELASVERTWIRYGVFYAEDNEIGCEGWNELKKTDWEVSADSKYKTD